jgi:hypothetical protein
MKKIWSLIFRIKGKFELKDLTFGKDSVAMFAAGFYKGIVKTALDDERDYANLILYVEVVFPRGQRG